MATPACGVRGSLLQLQQYLSAADRCGAAMASYQLIRGLGQECVLSAGPAVLGGYRAGPAALRAVQGRVSVSRFLIWAGVSQSRGSPAVFGSPDI